MIAGVELRCCVLFAVLGADEHGYRFVVPQDLVSGLDCGDDSYNATARRLLAELYDARRPREACWTPGAVTPSGNARPPRRQPVLHRGDRGDG